MSSARFRRIVATLSRRQPDLTVAMENVHKTRNLGAIGRTCDAVGIGTVHAIAPHGTRVKLGHKTAGGSEKWLTVVRHDSLDLAYGQFHEQRLTIIAADVGAGAVDFRSIDYTQPCVLVVGSELDGLSTAAAQGADQRIHVPLMGMVESLNVSVASAIVLYEAARQRELAGCYAQRRLDDEQYHRLLFEWLHPSVARYCRDKRQRYPRLNEAGEISEAVSGNPRRGFARFSDGMRRS